MVAHRDGHKCAVPARDAVTEQGLSARAHDKILRLARTIADLDDAEHLNAEHIYEAINYRMLDRDLWK